MINDPTLILEVAVAPSTVLTESQMLAALQVCKVVTRPASAQAMQFAASLPSAATTPATLFGLVAMLQDLVKLNPDSNPADYAKLEAYLKQLTSTGTDHPLTFGLFLALVKSIPPGAYVPVKPNDSAPQAVAVKHAAHKA